VDREDVLVGIDVGTSKVCALIGELSRDGNLTIIGKGVVPASGLKKAVVINIEQTTRSITGAVEHAERLAAIVEHDRVPAVERDQFPAQPAGDAHEAEGARL